MTVGALKFKHTSVPRQDGERSRLKVVQGPDFGTVYIITARKATIGRGEESDIILSDLKSSRSHAEVSQNAKSEWIVKDLQSANGILVNGKSAKNAVLKFHDTITLGETTLEFLTADSGTQMLVAPARNIETVNQERAALLEQKKRVQALAGFGGGRGAPISGGGGSLFGNSKILLGVAVVGAILYMMPSSTPHTPVKKASETDAARDLASFLPGADTAVSSKSAEGFYRQGFREYLEGNYLRAKVQFETALQIAPNHVLARLYLENCTREIKDQVDQNLDRGRKSADAGKIKEARNHFEAVLRLLYRDQTNPSYIEAKELLDRLNAKDDSTSGSGGSG